jgi:hypothetical protein
MALGQALQIIGKRFNPGNAVIEAGNMKPFGLKHVKIVFKIRVTAVVADHH